MTKNLTVVAPLVLGAVAVILSSTSRASAQTPSLQTSSTAAAPEKRNLRFFQQFITDAAIIDKQWYSGELRFERGAVPLHENANGFLFTPTLAMSPLKNLEVGGQVSYIDYHLDDEHTDGFDGESGLGDLTVWGKYRFLEGDLSISAGLLLDLPTGSEDDGLGTGKVVPGLFGGIRAKVGPGSLAGSAGLRFTRDASIADEGRNGKTSTFLGGGYLWEPVEDLAVSGELTVESERFDGASSDFRITAGAQWLGIPHSSLRGALSVGLTDAAPDFEIILGYAYSF